MSTPSISLYQIWYKKGFILSGLSNKLFTRAAAGDAATKLGREYTCAGLEPPNPEAYLAHGTVREDHHEREAMRADTSACWRLPLNCRKMRAPRVQSAPPPSRSSNEGKISRCRLSLTMPLRFYLISWWRWRTGTGCF